eukprot:CAMPEP_0115094906 /NCGR_PEP_ID=MMETSP0227-20121206/28672_1 /TAXON_ID=89957 /ORGANISM="Polarella glacialis, Strain CCMP 1383" /LENGTH=144 /DNA_ID=CAMNT_0002488069 /DNA_START=215 /DNA_END=649 /DNA_ORIENTATION=-
MMVSKDSVDIELVMKLYLNNPNGPPFRATITDLEADVYSLDKLAANKIGTPEKLGNTVLPKSVEVLPKTESIFDLNLIAELTAAESPTAVSRFNRDCGLLAEKNKKGVKETMVRIHVTKLVAEALNQAATLPEITFDTLIPCDT